MVPAAQVEPAASPGAAAWPPQVVRVGGAAAWSPRVAPWPARPAPPLRWAVAPSSPPTIPGTTDISGYPLHPSSATYIASMSPSTAFHPDWGTMSDGYGIPFGSGTGATPQPITWTASWGPTESDKLPCPTGTNQFCYPIPLDRA